MSVTMPSTPIFDALFSEVDDTTRHLVVEAIADKPHASDVRECVNCGDDVRYLSSRDWCDSCEAAVACDDCGRDDDELTPNPDGTFWCADCSANRAYDAAGDRA